jgi:hypothetical protein
MSHMVEIAQGRKTRWTVAFLPIDFRLGVSMWVPSIAHHPSNMVAWEKRRSLVMKSCLISMPALRMLSWRVCA